MLPAPTSDLTLLGRRAALGRLAAAVGGVAGAALLAGGCSNEAPTTGELEKVWGSQGTAKGRFQKPRAIAIDAKDQLYIVDMTARIQVFTRDGEYLRHWQTPQFQYGKPSGLAFNHDGNLIVADTHYYRMLVYTPEGKLLAGQTIGGVGGPKHGEFGFVTDCVQDSRGNYYIAEYGENDRVQKFTKDGKFLLQIGSHGPDAGQFLRPQKMDIDADDRLWVTDACNHRIQIWNCRGDEATLERTFGTAGSEPGELRYPYDLTLDGQGHLYVAEFGNSRIQKFDLAGNSLATWGSNGRRPGQLFNPWGVVRDSLGRLHIVDTYNHRVQRVWF